VGVVVVDEQVVDPTVRCHRCELLGGQVIDRVDRGVPGALPDQDGRDPDVLLAVEVLRLAGSGPVVAAADQGELAGVEADEVGVLR